MNLTKTWSDAECAAREASRTIFRIGALLLALAFPGPAQAQEQALRGTLLIDARIWTNADQTTSKPANMAILYIGTAEVARCSAIATDGTPENAAAAKEVAEALAALLDVTHGADFGLACSNEQRSTRTVIPPP